MPAAPFSADLHLTFTVPLCDPTWNLIHTAKLAPSPLTAWRNSPVPSGPLFLRLISGTAARSRHVDSGDGNGDRIPFQIQTKMDHNWNQFTRVISQSLPVEKLTVVLHGTTSKLGR